MEGYFTTPRGSGILPVNAHAVINNLNLIYINSFILYSCVTKLSNEIHYNKFLEFTVQYLLESFSGFLPANAHLPVNTRLILPSWRSRTNATVYLLNGRSLAFLVCSKTADNRDKF